MVCGLAFPLKRGASTTPRRGALLLGLALGTALHSGGCVRWRPVSLDAVRRDAVDLRLHRVRLEGPTESAELVAHHVAWPRLEGHDLRLHSQRAWDLEQTRRVWVRGTDPAAAGPLVGGVYAAVLVLGWIAIFRELPGISGP